MSYFKSLTNIDTAFHFTKIIAFASIITSFIISIVALILIYNITTNQEIVVVDNINGNAFVGKKSTKEENIKAEIKGHMDRFYGTFFTYTSNNVNKQVEKGVELGDDYVKELYKTTTEKGWYNLVKQNNIEQLSYVDTVLINDNVYPYEVLVKGHQERIRSGAFTAKYALNITCEIYNTVRSASNPHGLLISKIDIQNYKID